MSSPSVSTRPYQGVAIPTPGTFVLDPAHTTVGFVARHLVVSKVRGGFTTATGTITVADEPLASTVEVTIDAASIDTGVADRDAHLRGADFLDVERYPALIFVSREITEVDDTGFKLVGDLTIREVSREVVLDVEFEGAARSPWGQEVIAFTATTEIDREEFGITWNQALETGGVLVGKKVKIEITAEATRKV